MQTIEIAALNTSLNSVPFCIRGRVNSISSDQHGHTASFRVTATTKVPPRSLTRLPSAEVFLHGRWRIACRPLAINQLVQIDNGRLRSTRQGGVSIHLHVPDGNIQHTYRLCHLHVLNDDMSRHSSLNSLSLAQCSPAQIPVIAQKVSVPNRHGNQSHSKYTYESVAQLWSRTRPDGSVEGSRKVNVFGVVIDYRAPYATRGPDLRCEVEIVDESSIGESDELRTLKMYCFERQPQDCIPFRAVGDIIRAQRVELERYIDRTNKRSILQAKGRFYSAFVLWKREDDDFAHVARRDAIGKAQKSRRVRSAEVLTDLDCDRISALRGWSKQVMHKRIRIHRAFLRTIPEILAARACKDPIDSCDVLCAVERLSTLNDRTVHLYATDRPHDDAAASMLIRSGEPGSLHHPPFLDFCPHLVAPPSPSLFWVLLRDLEFSGTNPRICFFRSRVNTTSVIWLPIEFAMQQLRADQNPPIPTSGSRFWVAQERDDASQDPSNVQRLPLTRNQSAATPPYSQLKASGNRDNSSLPGAVTNIDSRDGNDFDTTVSEIRSATAHGEKTSHKLSAIVKAYTYPKNLRNACRRTCTRCLSVVAESGVESGQCLSCPLGQRIDWLYKLRLLVEDKHGERIEVWVTGTGDRIFPNVRRSDIQSDDGVYLAFLQVLSSFCNGKPTLFHVVPYEYEDNYGIYRIACHLLSVYRLAAA
eukprot:GFKZ01010383.1.p1 GENE.GFKZ01010383.1~~GFKZ01010383.1.p1  ORF type:complete len:701 (-),score=32.96 GFKZ01010383.1:2075-4177(-)